MASVQNLTTGTLALIERRPLGSPVGTPDVEVRLTAFGAPGDTGTIPDSFARSTEITNLVTAGKLAILSYSTAADSDFGQDEFNRAVIRGSFMATPGPVSVVPAANIAAGSKIFLFAQNASAAILLSTPPGAFAGIGGIVPGVSFAVSTPGMAAGAEVFSYTVIA